MTKDKFPTKAKETSSSHAVVIAASLLIACLMPVVRSLAHGDYEAAVFASAHAPVAASSAIPRGDVADEVSMLAVGAFLLGLGSVMRRVA
jgi:hypothetical protein